MEQSKVPLALAPAIGLISASLWHPARKRLHPQGGSHHPNGISDTKVGARKTMHKSVFAQAIPKKCICIMPLPSSPSGWPSRPQGTVLEQFVEFLFIFDFYEGEKVPQP